MSARQALSDISAESKKKTVKGKTPYEVKMKLMRFAAGRGFEPAEISRCLDCGDIWEE